MMLASSPSLGGASLIISSIGVLSVTVSEAISDLPELSPGQNGSNLSYKSPPENVYQQLMRGVITPKEYLKYFAIN